MQEVTLKVKDLNVMEGAKKEEAEAKPVASKKKDAPADSQPNELQVMEAPLSQKPEPELPKEKTNPEVTVEKTLE